MKWSVSIYNEYLKSKVQIGINWVELKYCESYKHNAIREYPILLVTATWTLILCTCVCDITKMTATIKWWNNEDAKCYKIFACQGCKRVPKKFTVLKTTIIMHHHSADSKEIAGNYVLEYKRFGLFYCMVRQLTLSYCETPDRLKETDSSVQATIHYFTIPPLEYWI